MSGSFPQLLKRSAFVTHDPIISRVYASTPQAISQAQDWGLKFPVHRTKPSQFIKVESLDGGPGIDATWTSAEKEVRFMRMWGDGSVPWIPAHERLPRRAANPSTSALMEDLLETPPVVSQYVPNVETMTESEFESYLAHVRENRHELRETIFTDASGTDAEVATLPHAAAKDLTGPTASADFQANLTARELAEPSSKRLNSQPHRLHGIAYSSAPAAGALLDPSRVHKGRVLDRLSRSPSHSYRTGTNADFVVGLGGLTASGASGQKRVHDRATLQAFDYTRESPDRGVASFRISEAALNKPAGVIGVKPGSQNPGRWMELPYRKTISGAALPGPLDSFRFNIAVEETQPAEEVGSAKWVSRENAPRATVAEVGMGVLGGPRATRVQGQGALAARKLGASVQAGTIDSLLARISRQ